MIEGDLELHDDGRSVHWDGSRSGMRCSLMPHGRFEQDGRVCRKVTLIREFDGGRVTKRGSACRYGEGEWRMING